MIRLSIIIPCHSRVDLLARCLASLDRYASPNTEIIVVDDGSPGACVSLLALTFAQVRTIRHDRAKGFAAAINAGIQLSRGTFIELLNDDTQVCRGWDEQALKAFVDERIGAVAPLVLQGKPHAGAARVDSAGDFYDPGGFAGKRWHGLRVTAIQPTQTIVQAASGSSMFLRRSALEKTGLFAESFGAYFEDVDLSLRLGQAGYKILFQPDSIVWHAVGSTYGQRGRTLVENQSCNEEKLFWRHWARSWKYLVRHLVVLGAKSVRRMREGRFIPFAVGRVRAIADLWLKQDDRVPMLEPCFEDGGQSTP